MLGIVLCVVGIGVYGFLFVGKFVVFECWERVVDVFWEFKRESDLGWYGIGLRKEKGKKGVGVRGFLVEF